MSIENLIKNAVAGNASEFEETFADIMSQKMENAIAAKYDDMFEEGYKKKMKEEDESDEDESDDDEDDDEDDEDDLDEAAVVTHKWYSTKNWKDGSDHFDNLDDHLRGHTAKHAQTGNTSRDRPDHHFGIPVKAKSAISYMDRYAKPVSESVELDNGVER